MSKIIHFSLSVKDVFTGFRSSQTWRHVFGYLSRRFEKSCHFYLCGFKNYKELIPWGSRRNLPNRKASHSKSTESSTSLLWRPQISKHISWNILKVRWEYIHGTAACITPIILGWQVNKYRNLTEW
jgi:hypothetical protein